MFSIAKKLYSRQTVHNCRDWEQSVTPEDCERNVIDVLGAIWDEACKLPCENSSLDEP